MNAYDYPLGLSLPTHRCGACGLAWPQREGDTRTDCPNCDGIAPSAAAPRAAEAEGRKLDTGKSRADLLVSDFPRALLEVGKVAGFGAAKYAEHNWLKVENGGKRYAAALLRHALENGKCPSSVDAESGFLHLAHVAWNALAILELALIELERGGE